MQNRFSFMSCTILDAYFLHYMLIKNPTEVCYVGVYILEYCAEWYGMHSRTIRISAIIKSRHSISEKIWCTSFFRKWLRQCFFTLCVRCSLKLVGAISFVRFSSTIHEIFQQNTEKYQLCFYLLHIFCKFIVVPKVIFQNDANSRKEVIERQTRM